MVNPGGLEPLAAGLKVPCPADPGLIRSGSARSADAATSAPVCEDATWKAPELVDLRGFDPRFPAYRASALATRRQVH
jgi:hypothetical protein